MKILTEAKNLRSGKINKIEELKEGVSFSDAKERLLEISQNGYEHISNEMSSFYLKCFGLFDKGEDSFMIRVRVPAGRLTQAQAIAIGEVAKEFGDDYIDITTRQQIELRYIKTQHLYEVISRLEKVGVTTYQTGIDNFRNVVTSPLDGLLESSVVETYPIIEELQSIYLKKEEWIGVLPRKFNTAILGDIQNDCNIYGHDCCFVVAQKGDIKGFNVYLGGKVGVQASQANIFLAPDEIKEFFLSLINLYKEFGFRDNRNKNRLHFLIEAVGMEEFVKSLKEYAQRDFQTSGELLVKSEAITQEITQLKGDIQAHHLSIPSGIFSGSDLIEVARFAPNIRLSVEQSLYLIDVDASFKSSDIYQKYAKFNNPFFLNTIACAGTATCSFGVIPNKPDAIEMSTKLHERFGDIDAKIRLYWSACPKGCGIHGVADIGFEGCKAKDSEGNRVDGVHIFLGGKASLEAKEARVIYKSLPLSQAYEKVESLVAYYLENRVANESFESFDTRVFVPLEVEEITQRVSS